MNIKSNRASWRLMAPASLVVFLGGCSTAARNYTWGWWAVSPFTPTGSRNLRFLVQGLVPTLGVSTVAFVVSVVLGLTVALVGFSRHRVLRLVNRGYVELFRSIPVLVMVLWVYYGLPVSFGIELNTFSAAVVALALCDSAFEAEIFRAGIQSIASDQRETALSLGFTRLQTMRYIIFPQAFRRILPPLGNQFVYMLKVSSLVSVIGLPELTRKANELTVIEYRPLEIYTILIVEYLALILVASFLVRKLEKHMRERNPE